MGFGPYGPFPGRNQGRYGDLAGERAVSLAAAPGSTPRQAAAPT